jgi:hypothetical protein
MRAGNDELRTLRILVDLEQQDLDSLARSISLSRHLLARGHHCLSLAELDDHGAGVGSLDRAVDDLALPIGELLVDGVALVIANALEHDLLCGLRRDPAKVFRRALDPQSVPHFRGRRQVERLGEKHIVQRIFDFFDHVFDQIDLNQACICVYRDVDILFSVLHLLVDGLEGMLDGREYGFFRDSALSRYLGNC